MAIKEILDRIKGKLGTDDAEAIALLADAQREANDMTDSLSAANRESAGRKSKIRELETQIETQKGEIEKLSALYKSEELVQLRKKAELYETKIKAEEDGLRSEWEKKANLFSIPETDKRYAQIQTLKGDFAFAENDTPLGIDAIRNNMRLFDLLTKAKVFDETAPLPATGTPPTTPTPIPNIPQGSGDAVVNLLSKNSK
jgi:TolA-binding protein